MNPLKEYFEKNNNRLIHKWEHYFDVYDQYLHKYRSKPVNILEIGVFHGGSLQMWKNYFGSQAKIYGLDIDPKCKSFEEDQIKIFIGSQADKAYLHNLKKELPPLDIIIDDGSHLMNHQIISFQTLYPYLSDNGIYICEDLHTSYDYRYGGGHKRKGTFIEFSKNLIDHLNAYHSEQSSLKVNDFTKSTFGIHFYDSMLVLEKRKRDEPKDYISQQGSISENNSIEKRKKLKKDIKFLIHRGFQFLRLPSIK